MLSSLLVVFTAAVGFVSAQTNTTTNFTTCCQINPDSVSSTTLVSWCHEQLITCLVLCDGQCLINTCEPTTLTYQCLCTNGTAPNVPAYGKTLPSLECEAWVDQCTAAHPNDSEGQAFCQSFICGNMTAGGSATGSPSSGTNTASSTSGSASAATYSNAAAPAGPIYYGGHEIGIALIITVLAAVFGFAL